MLTPNALGRQKVGGINAAALRRAPTKAEGTSCKLPLLPLLLLVTNCHPSQSHKTESAVLLPYCVAFFVRARGQLLGSVLYRTLAVRAAKADRYGAITVGNNDDMSARPTERDCQHLAGQLRDVSPQKTLWGPGGYVEYCMVTDSLIGVLYEDDGCALAFQTVDIRSIIP